MKGKFPINQTTELIGKLEKRSGKPMPRDLESEKFVLSSMLGKKNNFDMSLEIFNNENPFYASAHQALYTVYQRLYAKDRYPDVVSVANYIETNSLSELIPYGLLAELTTLSMPASFSQHCKHVKDLDTKRKAIIIFERLITDAYLESVPNAEILDAADVELLKLRDGKHESEPTKISELLHYLEEDERGNGLLSGFPKLDEMLNDGAGALGGDYIVIGARPSVGKTTLALNICANALREGKGALFFSAEMKNKKIIRKFFECFSGIPAWKIQGKYNQYRGQLNVEELQRVQAVREELKTYSCFFDETNGLNPQDLRARIGRWKSRYSVGVVFIDYIQLINPIGTHYSRDSEVRSISAAIKSMAKEFDVPFYVLSQLNRDSIKRDSKRPSVGDLRDSGALEQDADVIILPFDPVQVDTGNQENERLISLIVGKNRLGPCGDVSVKFTTTISKFEQTDVQIPEPEPKAKKKPYLPTELTGMTL